MEQRLHEILMDGEQVRWTGRPSPFKLMRCPERNTFFVTWLLSGAAILLALLYLLPTLNSARRSRRVHHAGGGGLSPRHALPPSPDG